MKQTKFQYQLFLCLYLNGILQEQNVCIFKRETSQDAQRLAQMYPEQVSIVKYEEVAKKPKTTLPILLKVNKDKNKIHKVEAKQGLVIFHCSSLASPGTPAPKVDTGVRAPRG